MTDAVEWTGDSWNNPPTPTKPVDTPEEPFRNVPDQQLGGKRPQNDRVRVRTVLSTKSMTDKTQAGETDINEIVRKYRRSGVLPGEPPGTEQFADVSEISNLDYGEAVERLREAQEALHTAQEEAQQALEQQQGVDPLTTPGGSDTEAPEAPPSEQT